jgi:ABC-type multidrug transport system fused ATPase/permease subunit
VIKKNIFYVTFKKLDGVLLLEHKKKAGMIFLMVIVAGILEVFGLAVILPVISVAIDSSVIHSNVYLERFFSLLNFNNDTIFLFFLLGLLISIFILKNFFSTFIGYRQARYSYKISTDIARLQFVRYYNKDLQFFIDNNSNILYQNIRSASSWLSSFVLLPLISFFSESIVAITVITGMALYDTQIFIMVTVTLIPVFLLMYRLIKNKIQKLEINRASFEVEANKNLYQTLNGYIDVKLFNKDNYFIKLYLGFQEKLNDTQAKVTLLQSLPTKIIEITAILGVIVIIIYSKIFASESTSLIPLLSLYIIAAYRLMPSMNRMLVALMSIKSYQFTFDILKNIKEESSRENKQSREKILFQKEIRLDSIRYTYPQATHSTLQDISITIKKGERIGFIGQSGAGKTTLINILLRFIKENKGSIVIDNELQLVDENINVWRELIGYVKQNVFIIDGDFYENIAFGLERSLVNEEKMQQVIRSSKLDEVIKKLPNGLNTNIGENGTKLSGGQRQRIAIARALYKDAQILIFDEATSALDSETEKEITEAIDSLSAENKTMFIIAHRISTLKNCDKIVEMAHGKIMRVCSYQELINLNPK